MKKQIKQKRNWKNYILPVFLTVIMLSVLSVYALGYVSENRQQISKTIINDTGMFYNDGSIDRAVSSGTADVVVCRGNDIYDDIYKSIKWASGCDVVCKSSDTAYTCVNKINSIISDSTIIYFSSDTFNLFSNSSDFIKIDGKKDIFISAFTTIFNVSFTGNVAIGIFVNNSNNINIQGLHLIGNLSCGTGCFGINVQNSRNVYLENVFVEKVAGFQVFFNTRDGGNSDNLNLLHSTIIGTGINDAVGGGPTNHFENFSDISVIDNKLYQNYSVATTDGAAINMVGCDSCKFNFNTAYGQMIFGSETKGTTNSEMIGNILYKINASDQTYISSSNATSHHNTIANNRVIGGVINLRGSDYVIQGNHINVTLPAPNTIALSCSGNNNIFSANVITGGNIALYSLGDNALISDNIIYNPFSYASGIGIDIEAPSFNPKISGNKFYLTKNNTVNYAIYTATNVNNGLISDNLITSLNSTGSGFPLYQGIRVYGFNFTIINNDLQGNMTNKIVLSQYQNYVDSYGTYDLSATVCDKIGVFYLRSITNATGFGYCNGTNWRFNNFNY